MFDGESYKTDGKVWQVCDITDPLLKELLDNAPIRPECDANSGFYHGGLWAKVKAIMKTKLVAIQFGKHLNREDFAPTLEFGDRTPPRTASTSYHLPLPSLHLTNEELKVLRGRDPPQKKSSGYNARLRDTGNGSRVAPEPSPTPNVTGSVVGTDKMDSDNIDYGSEGDDDDETENEEYTGIDFDDERERYEPHQYDDEDGDMSMDMGMGMGRMAYPELD
jgi:general transcription factor 3C polypeptide 5 (transcription factor C subunit 1)